MPTERGEAIGKPGRAEPQRPHRGAITATADPVPRPPLWWLLSRLSYSDHSLAAAPKRSSTGNGAPLRAPLAASEHRNGAHPRRLQLAGDGKGREQRHEPWLLHRPTTAADVDRDAGLRPGFAAAGVDVHEHLTDRAAEGGGSHGWMARNTDPTPRRRGRARARPGGRDTGAPEGAVLRQPWRGRGGEGIAG